jgi:hypothetical protein
MTPPFNISARPVFRRRLVDLPLLFDISPLFTKLVGAPDAQLNPDRSVRMLSGDA